MFGCDLNISIVNDADESVVVAPTCMEGNGLIGNTTLPSAATYRIVVDPVSSVNGTVTLTLNDVTDVPDSAVSIDRGALPPSRRDTSAEAAPSAIAWPSTNLPPTETNRLYANRPGVVPCDVGISVISP
jgi:hypothetical protein